MSELTLHQKQMIELDKEKARLSLKLREVHSIMRQNGIGHLYPGTTPEHEYEVMKATHASSENYFALQRLSWHVSAEMESWKRITHNITSWLQLNYPDIRVELPSELFNVEMAMELDVKKLLSSKRGDVINGYGKDKMGLITK